VSEHPLEQVWVAVQVRVKREKAVAAILRQAGYEEFLPLSSQRRAGRLARRAQPLFPGYVFCRYSLRIAYRIVQAPGVIRILGEAHAPTPVQEEEILALQRVVTSGVHSEPWRFAEPGMAVRVTKGPLRGLEGSLVAVKNAWRLIVSVTLLRRAIAAEVWAEDVEPSHCGPYEALSRGECVTWKTPIPSGS
jgi:transcription antitermination factor NusG